MRSNEFYALFGERSDKSVLGLRALENAGNDIPYSALCRNIARVAFRFTTLAGEFGMVKISIRPLARIVGWPNIGFAIEDQAPAFDLPSRVCFGLPPKALFHHCQGLMASNDVERWQIDQFASLDVDSQDHQMEMVVVSIGMRRADHGAVFKAKGFDQNVDGLFEIPDKIVALANAYYQMLDGSVADPRYLHQRGKLFGHQIWAVRKDMAR